MRLLKVNLRNQEFCTLSHIKGGKSFQKEATSGAFQET